MEIKTMLHRHISAIPDQNPVLLFLLNFLGEDLRKAEIVLEADALHYGEKKLPLQKKNMINRLLASFLAAPRQQLTRNALIQELYEMEEERTMSRRQKESMEHNIVKLLSRTRKLIESAFHPDPYLEWLPYDAKNKTWKLYRFKYPAFEETV